MSYLMDLVALWEHVPLLLTECMCDDIPIFRNMRLVNKEASRVALLGLRSYTLTLTGLDCSRFIIGARLLQETRLHDLSVHLLMSDSYNPSSVLEACVRETGLSLSTVTNLSLYLQDSTRNVDSAQSMHADELSEALEVLVAACSSLRSFTHEGHLSSAFLRRLGETCPLLTALTVIRADASDLPCLQDIASLQPPLLPHLRSLTFEDCRSTSILPDMSQNQTLTMLSIPSCNLESSDWSKLPRTLQHLRCITIHDGPLFLNDDVIMFPNLLSVKVGVSIDLHALAQLLRAAPLLRDINTAAHWLRPMIFCFLTSSAAAVHHRDFALLQQMMHVHPFIEKAQFAISFEPREPHSQTAISPWYSALPCMTGVEKCNFMCLEPGELSALLNGFLTVTEVGLGNMDGLTDVELQDMAKCVHLQTLDISSCNNVTLAGLLSLCLLCPNLTHVDCRHCAQLKGPVLEVCKQLLAKHGRLIKVVFG